MLLLVTSLAKSVLLMPFMSRDENVATFVWACQNGANGDSRVVRDPGITRR